MLLMDSLLIAAYEAFKQVGGAFEAMETAKQLAPIGGAIALHLACQKAKRHAAKLREQQSYHGKHDK